MNYIKIDECDLNNGDGVRVVLWVAGCSHHCEGCHNPETWDYNAGQEFDEEAMNKIYRLLENPYITGLTITGGDPMAKENRAKVCEIMFLAKSFAPEKDIWLWTGYNLIKDDGIINYLSNADVIIDGKYEKDNPTTKKFRGSDNQKMYRKINGTNFIENTWELVD